MVRLDRLESALVHLTDVIVLQGERMDFGFSSLREEMRTMREEMRTMREETRGMSDQTQGFCQTVTDRLDRLIAITTKERTTSVERLQSIE